MNETLEVLRLIKIYIEMIEINLKQNKDIDYWLNRIKEVIDEEEKLDDR